MGFKSGQHHPDGPAGAPEPQPEFDPETAGPDQVVEHFRDDVLYRDIVRSEALLEEMPDVNSPEERRTQLLDWLCVRNDDAKLYLLHKIHDPINDRFNPASEPAEAFLATISEADAEAMEISREELTVVQLNKREAILHRAYDDALGLQQEHILHKSEKNP